MVFKDCQGISEDISKAAVKDMHRLVKLESARHCIAKERLKDISDFQLSIKPSIQRIIMYMCNRVIYFNVNMFGYGFM